jgi:hypothetical protein
VICCKFALNDENNDNEDDDDDDEYDEEYDESDIALEPHDEEDIRDVESSPTISKGKKPAASEKTRLPRLSSMTWLAEKVFRLCETLITQVFENGGPEQSPVYHFAAVLCIDVKNGTFRIPANCTTPRTGKACSRSKAR